tara:strand:- start:176 stop:367 length:192 start_codon:yes stop_codon:yes gene_type:complete
MIKWIKSLLKKIFSKKEEPVILENEVEYEIGTVVETPVIEKIVCNTHKTRFKKSCPTCIAAAK